MLSDATSSLSSDKIDAAIHVLNIPWGGITLRYLYIKIASLRRQRGETDVAQNAEKTLLWAGQNKTRVRRHNALQMGRQKMTQ